MTGFGAKGHIFKCNHAFILEQLYFFGALLLVCRERESEGEASRGRRTSLAALGKRMHSRGEHRHFMPASSKCIELHHNGHNPCFQPGAGEA